MFSGCTFEGTIDLAPGSGAGGTGGAAGSGGRGGSGGSGTGGAGGVGGVGGGGAGGAGGAPMSDAGASDSGAGSDAATDGSAEPTAGDLLARLRSCTPVSAGRYSTDVGTPANIPICQLVGAVFWQADMDIDCDGRVSAQCNASTDPAFMPQTSATESNGQYLDAATLPYVVVPLPSSRFDYSTAGIQFGTVIAVLYSNRVEYGVFGDEGPAEIIGEASYAMAQRLGIDPNPSTGGVDSGVSYIVFTGPSGVAAPIEDHNQAVRVGQMRALQFLQDNPP
ncbi:MAG TPA: glycoside hydrolase family 75 protein [Polyangia bacterium]|nr:glycoside hydrolase family 75 protein [Polyangia bacterium]